MLEILTSMNDSITWLCLGGILLLLECVFINSIYLLFIVAGAFFVSVLLQIGIISADDIFVQIFIVSIVSGLCSLIFYRRKKYIGNSKIFNNIIGDEVKIIASSFINKEVGNVKWSGTVMNAKYKNTNHSSLNENAKHIVVAIEGNVLIIEEVK